MNAVFLSGSAIKLYVAIGMVGVWLAILVLKIQGAEDLVSLCKYGLTALASHYLTYADPAKDVPPVGPAPVPQGDPK